MTFKFDMGSTVTLTESHESGTVIGRGEYDHSESCYLVRYVAADGRQVESWLQESALLAGA